MHGFYAPPDALSGETIIFPDDEAHHAARVLRVKTGDEAIIVDGEGKWYRVRLDVLGRKSVIGAILERRENVGEPDYDLTIAVALLKNPSRFETFVEKAVELGACRIVPLITKRTEKSRLKMSRANAILVSAMKQSGRSRLVALDEPVKIRKWYKSEFDKNGEFLAICHETAPMDSDLASLLKRTESYSRAIVMVGPEGGFTDEEIERACERGFQPVSLGPRRLRTETAAMSVAAIFMIHNHMTRLAKAP